MKRQLWLLPALAAGIFLAACGSQNTSNDTLTTDTGLMGTTPPPPADQTAPPAMHDTMMPQGDTSVPKMQHDVRKPGVEPK